MPSASAAAIAASSSARSPAKMPSYPDVEADGVLSLLAEKSRAAALLPPMLSII